MKLFTTDITLGSVISICTIIATVSMGYSSISSQARENSQDVSRAVINIAENTADIGVIKTDLAVITQRTLQMEAINQQNAVRFDAIIEAINAIRGEQIRIQTLVDRPPPVAIIPNPEITDPVLLP